jgi:hypothetical protein
MMDWDEELKEEDRDQLIELLAQKVHKKGLHTPAILFLEMHKPFSFLTGQTLILSSGFLVPLFGVGNIQHYAKLLEARENVERIICRIEELQANTKSIPS